MSYVSEWKKNNKDKVRESYKQYDLKYPGKRKQKNIEWHKNNVEQSKNIAKKSYLKNIDKRKEYNQKYYILNKDKFYNRGKLYRLINKKILNEKYVEKKHNDIRFRFIHNLRSRISLILKLKNIEKNNHSLEYIGCSKIFLLQWIESQFDDNMSWSNYGNGKDQWSHDHIIALQSKNINLNDRDQLLKVCNYKNITPMWNKDNWSKGNKNNGGDVKSQC